MSQSLSSPLTLQMLMASSQTPQDPAITAALPRIQLAQSMIQNGLSDAPTTKLGAFSRLGQAILGNVMYGQANSGLQDILQQRAQQAGAANSYIMGGAQTPAGTPTAPPPTPASTDQPAGASPPGNFATRLASSEGSPGSVNSQGFSGQYQFGVPRLIDDGVYHPADGENPKANEWKGTFNIPGFPGVKTQSDFLANVPAQNAVLGLDIQNTDKAIANTPGAAAFDQNGLRGVAHLGGIKGMQNFVATGGATNPNDANGTTLMDYYNKFSHTPGGVQQVGGAPAPATSSGPAPFEVIKRAYGVLSNPAMMYNPQAQQMAHNAIEQAKIQLGMGNYVKQADGTYINTYGGKPESAPSPALNYRETSPGIYTSPGAKPEFAPAPRTATDVHGNTVAVGGGGQTTSIFTNPTGIGGNSPESEMMRTLAELGPKVVNGTATDQEKATYNTIATSYQNFKTQTSPATQGLIRVPERPLPPGMPANAGASPPIQQSPPGQPSGTPQPGNAMPPQTTTQPGVTELTPSGRGPAAAQAVTEAQAAADAKAISEEQASVMKGHSALGATAAIRAELPNVTVGPGSDGRLALARYGTLLGIPNDDLKGMIGTDPVSGELLQKKLFEIQTHALRLMGAREPGSVLQAYQKNFPNMASQNGTADSMTRMLDMDQIYGEDEIKGRQAHFNQQIAGVGQNKPYQGLGGYQQPDPRVYVSAALASGGRPFSEWAHGLTSQQQTDALKLAARAYPDATARDARGVVHRFQQQPPIVTGGGGG